MLRRLSLFNRKKICGEAAHKASSRRPAAETPAQDSVVTVLGGAKLGSKPPQPPAPECAQRVATGASASREQVAEACCVLTTQRRQTRLILAEMALFLSRDGASERIGPFAQRLRKACEQEARLNSELGKRLCSHIGALKTAHVEADADADSPPPQVAEWEPPAEPPPADGPSTRKLPRDKAQQLEHVMALHTERVAAESLLHQAIAAIQIALASVVEGRAALETKWTRYISKPTRNLAAFNDFQASHALAHARLGAMVEQMEHYTVTLDQEHRASKALGEVKRKQPKLAEEAEAARSAGVPARARRPGREGLRVRWRDGASAQTLVDVREIPESP